MIDKADTLFYKLEEKLITMITEREELLREKQEIKADNDALKKELDALKSEREASAKKLFELLSMVESAHTPSTALHHAANAGTHEHFSPSLAAIKPLVAQGQI